MTKWVALSAVGILGAVACAPASEPEDRTFDLEIADGALSDPGDLAVKQGDTVTINWNADEPVNVHLHGYDIEVEAAPDEPGIMTFEADATGGFSITLHELGAGSHEHEDDDHDADSGEMCIEPIPDGLSPQLSIEATPSMGSMEFDVSVILEDPPEAGSVHWHLYTDGDLTQMVESSSTSVEFASPGDYQLMAVLSSDATHCEYDVSAMTMVTVEEGDHEDDDEDEEVTLTKLVVNPR